MKPLAVFRMGSTYPQLIAKQGDFADWVVRGCRIEPHRLTIIDAAGGAALPAHEAVCAAILTGSHAYVTDRPPWSLEVAGWIRTAVSRGLPLLGICYGHQLIAEALGGRVGLNPTGLEFGTVAVSTAAAARRDRLFHSLAPRFNAHTCHAQTVLRPPPGAVVLAYSERDAHQALRVGDRCWGVQFHPEFDPSATRYYIDRHRGPLAEQGNPPDALSAGVRPTPRSSALLTAFAGRYLPSTHPPPSRPRI